MKKIFVSALISITSATLLVGVIQLLNNQSNVQQIDCVQEFTIDSENAFDTFTRFFLLTADELATADVDENNDVCIIRAIDFDAGPVLIGADTLRVGGRIAYRQANNCQAIGDTVVNNETIRFVICESLLTLCESEFGDFDVVLQELDDNEFVEQCRVDITFPVFVMSEDTMMMDSMDTMMPMDTMDTTMPMDTMDTTMPMDSMDTTMPVDTMDITMPMDTMDTTMPMDTMDTTTPMDTMDTTTPMDTMDTMMPMDTTVVQPPSMVTFGNGAMPCSLDGNVVSFRVTFQDDIETAGLELPIMDDTDVTVQIGGAPEVISVADIWNVNFTHQGVRLTWNPTGDIDPRTIRDGQFFRFFFNFGTDINEITSAARDPFLEGNPLIVPLGENRVVVQFGPGSSIGPIFDTEVELTIDQCELIEEDFGDGNIDGGGPIEPVIPPSDQIDTEVDCDNFGPLSFELADLSDSTFNVTETFIPSGTDPILSFAFDGVDFEVDTVLVIDSMIINDTIVSVDSIAVPDTSVVIVNSFQIDSTFAGTVQVALVDTSFTTDTMFVVETIGFNVDTMIEFDTSLVVDQVIVGIDTLMFSDSTFVFDTIFSLDTITVLDTVAIETIPILTIDTTFLGLDTIIVRDTVVVSGLEIIDSTIMVDSLFAIDTMLVIDTIQFSVDSVTIVDQQLVQIDTMLTVEDVTEIDTTFFLDSMLIVDQNFILDSMAVVDTTMINITETFNLDTSFVFQNAFTFDTIITMDTTTVIGETMVPDSILVITNILTSTDTSTVINTQTVIDSLFDIDTIPGLDTVLVVNTETVIDTTLSFDTMFVDQTVLTFDTTLTIFDTIFDADSMIVELNPIAFAIDTFSTVENVPVIDTSFTFDSTTVTTTTPVIEPINTFIQTFLGLDTMILVDTLTVIDSFFTQEFVLRENVMLTINSTLTVDSTFAIINDFNLANGDTICGSLRLGAVEGLNSLNYTLSWNTSEYDLLSCRNGEIPAFNCETSTTDTQNGQITASGDNFLITLQESAELAEYCVVVLDETIDSPDPFVIEQEYNNSRTLVERELLTTVSGLSLTDLGVLETQVLSNDGVSSFIVNRCLVLGANFDNGVAVLDGPGLAYQFSSGCIPSGTTSQSMPFEFCDARVETCCENLGTEDVVLVSFTTEGIINTCRFPLTVTDIQRTCNPIPTFECLATQTVSTNDITDNGDGTFSLGLDFFGLAGSEDHCLLRTEDFEEGPIRLTSGNLVIIDGRIAYPAVGCTSDDTFIEEVTDQSGNVVEQNSFDFVLCDEEVDFCCENFDPLEITIVTQPIGGTVITDVCQTSIRIEDSNLSIQCFPAQITCIDDMNAEDLIPDVLSSGICSISTELEFIDDLSQLDTCGIGIVLRTYFIDENADGQLSDSDVSCVQQITIGAAEAFDPMTIRWPVARTQTTQTSGLILTCIDSANFASEATDSIQLGGPLFCSSGDAFGEATWCDAGCQLIGYTMDTATSPGDSGGCAEVVITHTIIDWCTFTSLGSPEDDVNDLDFANFETIMDLRDGCQDCGNDGPETYLRYLEEAVNIDGIYTYLQTIIIEDDMPPVIDVPETFVVSTSRDFDVFGNILPCEGIDSFTMRASDVCGTSNLSGELTWNVNIRNFVALPVQDENGISSYTFTGDSFTISTRTGEEGIRYFVTMNVTDECGNTANTTTTIEFQDTESPVANCLEESPEIQVTEDGPTTIEASMFNDGSTDNCTIESSLRFSIVQPGEEPINPAAVNFGTQQAIDVSCSDFQGITSMDVWVWDLNFNGSRCLVDLNFAPICDDIPIDTTAAIISGTVLTPIGQEVEDVVVTLNSNSAAGNFPQILRTDENGAFSFINNELGQDYQLSATLDLNILLGVSTLDLVLIQQHILGISEFDDPLMVIASDADNSGGVSVSDIIIFRNVLVGLMPNFPNNDGWVVIPAGQEFFDPLSPFPFITEIDIFSLADDLPDQDFVAIKVGDVNYSGDVSTLSLQSTEIRSDERRLITVQDREVKAGEEFEVELSVSEIEDLKGFQFALAHDELEMLEINSSQAFNASNYHTNNELTKISWNDHSLDESGLTMTMTLLAHTDGRLSELISFDDISMVSEAYAQEDVLLVHPLALTFIDARENALLVSQNEPNPFSTQTQIDVFVSEEGPAKLTIFDITGSLVYENEYILHRGNNRLTINAEDLNSTGVLYYQVNANSKSTVQKMILIK